MPPSTRCPTGALSLPSFVAVCGFIFIVTVGTVEAFSVPTGRTQHLAPIAYNGVRTKSKTIRHQSNNKNDDEYDPRDDFGRSIRGLQSSALKTSIEAGDTVVCKRSLPNLNIYQDTSYEVKSIYTQSFDDETQQIIKQPLGSLEVDGSNNPRGVQVYMTLFSPQCHTEPVIVTPEEVGLITIRQELGNAVWLAVPGFFWVFLAASFYNTYHERTGGSLGDAFLGR